MAWILLQTCRFEGDTITVLRNTILCVTNGLTRGIHSMLQVYLLLTILIETYLISSYYLSPTSRICRPRTW